MVLSRVKISGSEDDSNSDLDQEIPSDDEENVEGFMIPLEEHPNFDENINFREETQETYQNRTAFDKEGVKTISILIMTFIHYHQY